jgi:signal transduction histidine kinase/ligand-binding sensor domain-containing protein
VVHLARALALVLLVVHAAPTAARASAGVSYRVWTTEEGLPQNSVRAIAQTPDGYLWVATFDGLVRFDGTRMVVYLRSDVPAMTSNRCLTLFVDTQGVLWVGTEDGGILRVHRGDIRGFGRASGLESEYVGAIGEDAEGRIWAYAGTTWATFDGARWKAAGPTKFTPRPTPLDRELDATDAAGTAPLDRRFRSMTADGVLWALDGPYLRRRHNGVWQTFSTPVPAAVRPTTVFFADREGSLWIGGDGGLVQATLTAVRGLVPDGSADDRNIYGVAEDASGRVWVTSRADPFLWERGSFVRLRGHSWWPPDWVLTIEPDADGSVLATGPTGIFKVWPHRGFERLGDGLPVVDVLRDRRGTLWAATTGRGLLRRTPDGWAEVRGLPSNDVKVVIESHDGALWVGTYGGLARVSDGALRTWTTADGLSSDRIRSLHEDDAGVLWVGTYDGGLNRFADGRFVAIRKRDGLFDDGAFVILDGGDGRYWMSSNRGVYSVAKQELGAFAAGATKRVSSRAWRAADGMPSSECNGGRQPSGLRAGDGTLWFPTQRGIAVIDPFALSDNTVPPPVVVEEVATERRSIALGEPVTLHPGERRIAVRYTANTFVRPDGVRFRYQLAGHEDWVDAGASRLAPYSYIPPGSYVLKIVAANSDGVWNQEGVALSIRVEPHWWQTGWFQAASSLVVLALLAGVYRQRVSSLKRRQVEQDVFARRLLDSQEAERKRIANEVHDGIGQTLAIIRTRAQLGLSEGDAPSVRRHLEEISTVALDGIDDVRKVAHGLRPAQLETRGLTRALEALVRQASGSTGIGLDASIGEVDGVVARADEINVYRIVQEAISNMVRHSQARRGYITVEVRGRDLEIRIDDDGVGFDPLLVSGGLGLTGIVERARILGGRAAVRSSPGKGTSLVVHVPAMGAAPRADASAGAGVDTSKHEGV